MFLPFFGVRVGSTNAVDRIFISTAWNQFINWALITDSAIESDLCAFARDGFRRGAKGKWTKSN